MTRRRIGLVFDVGDKTVLADKTEVYSLYANGRAPLNGGGGPGVPLGTLIGRVWQQGEYGWVAAPRAPEGEADSWTEEVNRSVRFFRNRREAGVFLWGFFMGTRRDKVRAALAALPGRVESEAGK